MGRVGLAFKVLFDGAFARQVAELQTLSTVPTIEHSTAAEPAAAKPVTPAKPLRSDAITLLATLQREARLLDFFKEPIADYQDAQIGAAVRDVHRLTNAALDRLFDIQPLLDATEGSTVDIPANADAAEYKLTGSVSQPTAGTGELMHHGWRAQKCELPQWTGSADNALVIAPAEVEVKAS
ncbi:MAG: DUF2760 domain-containing protein [Planctomycetaceae bacterium]